MHDRSRLVSPATILCGSSTVRCVRSTVVTLCGDALGSCVATTPSSVMRPIAQPNVRLAPGRQRAMRSVSDPSCSTVTPIAATASTTAIADDSRDAG